MKKILLLAFLIVVLAEALMRITFTIKGYPVGSLIPSWMYFIPVDSLVVDQQFYIDDAGIYKAKRDFLGKQNYYINRDGFRGEEFVTDTMDTAAVRVLFIGDSFTWGPYVDSNFCDMLNRKPSFICYNTGIPGNDPPQYEAVAKMYIPKLKPDYTILMFFLGNDLMEKPRDVVPNRDLYYQTNAGWLPSTYKGIDFQSAQQSYDYVAERYVVSGSFKRLLMKTALGTAIFSFPRRIEEYIDWTSKKKSKVANGYLQRIRAVCQEHNSRFLIFIIPSLFGDTNEDFSHDPFAYVKAEYPRLMLGVEDICYVLPMQKGQYWPLPDGHFNDNGHKAVAEIIESKVEKKY